MGPQYIVAGWQTLRQAMDKYTRWMNDQVVKSAASNDQTVDPAGM